MFVLLLAALPNALARERSRLDQPFNEKSGWLAYHPEIYNGK